LYFRGPRHQIRSLVIFGRLRAAHGHPDARVAIGSHAFGPVRPRIDKWERSECTSNYQENCLGVLQHTNNRSARRADKSQHQIRARVAQ
jgi:hypothetical protein